MASNDTICVRRCTVHHGQARASVPFPPHGLVEAAGAVDASERPMRVRRQTDVMPACVHTCHIATRGDWCSHTSVRRISPFTKPHESAEVRR
jgi:hypothetical protein